VTVSLNSICHVAPTEGFQQTADNVEVAGGVVDVLVGVMLGILVD
jgi:hypothetical protein